MCRSLANLHVDKAMEMAYLALDRIVANYPVDRVMITNLVKDSAGFAVLHDLIKVGFINAETHGQCFLVYRQVDGTWGPPLLFGG